MKHLLAQGLVALALAAAMPAAVGQTTVANPWIRGTVAQQKATGMFAQITSTAGARLVSASSPAAGVVEIHEMVMVDNVMKMRAIAGLDLPAGQPVTLKPGGHHVMLIELKQQLKPGDRVPVTLVVEHKDGAHERIEVQALVQPLVTPHDGMKH